MTAVGVLVPVYDQAAFLPRALEGLLAQQVDDWTALVLDDGSPDPAPVAAVVTELGDPRVRLVRSPDNRGLGATLNTGLDALDTPLVAYMPADDVWYPDHLAALLGCLAGPDVVLARSGLAEPSGTAYEQLVQVAHRVTADRWTERAGDRRPGPADVGPAAGSRADGGHRPGHLLLDPPPSPAVGGAARVAGRRAERLPQPLPGARAAALRLHRRRGGRRGRPLRAVPLAPGEGPRETGPWCSKGS